MEDQEYQKKKKLRFKRTKTKIRNNDTKINVTSEELKSS